MNDTDNRDMAEIDKAHEARIEALTRRVENLEEANGYQERQIQNLREDVARLERGDDDGN